MMADTTYRLEWYGDQVAAELKTALGVGLAAWSLYHEAAAKSQLAPGHGYLTGRIQRSIHADRPDHDFHGDFRPARSMPELGGKLPTPAEDGSRISVAVGTGIIYGQILNERLHFVDRGHDQAIGQLEPALAIAVKAAGYA